MPCLLMQGYCFSLGICPWEGELLISYDISDSRLISEEKQPSNAE